MIDASEAFTSADSSYSKCHISPDLPIEARFSIAEASTLQKRNGASSAVQDALRKLTIWDSKGLLDKSAEFLPAAKRIGVPSASQRAGKICNLGGVIAVLVGKVCGTFLLVSN